MQFIMFTCTCVQHKKHNIMPSHRIIKIQCEKHNRMFQFKTEHLFYCCERTEPSSNSFLSNSTNFLPNRTIFDNINEHIFLSELEFNNISNRVYRVRTRLFIKQFDFLNQYTVINPELFVIQLEPEQILNELNNVQ